MIFKNKHIAGKSWSFIFGLAQISDGIVRVLSLGFLSTIFPLLISRKQAEYMIKTFKNKKHHGKH